MYSSSMPESAQVTRVALTMTANKRLTKALPMLVHACVHAQHWSTNTDTPNSWMDIQAAQNHGLDPKQQNHPMHCTDLVNPV
jgi:hypothetical protein